MKKFSKTALGITAGLVAITGATIGIASYKTSKPFKPSFYNYKSYMSNDNQEYLRNEFDYKQFDEINQFTNALINHKAAAGIGTDFLAASLIQKHLLKKINYEILFEDEDLSSSKYSASQKRQIIKNALQTILRKEIWDHLTSYDKFLVDKNGDRLTSVLEDGKVVIDEFWEYFLPYYSQDMVVAYSLLKKNPEYAKSVLNTISKESRDDWSLSDFPEIETSVEELANIDFNNADNQLIDGTESPNDLVNILHKLHNTGYTSWTITDALRDNMLYGSSYWKKADGRRTAGDFTGDVEFKTYKELIDAFTDLVHDGTGYKVTNSDHISFKGDGLELLNNLINLSRLDVQAAIMYNGDGLDAYYGADNLPGWSIDGSIKSIKPKHNLLLVDGVVFSANNTDESNNRYLENLGNSLYANLKNEFKNIKENYNEILFNDFEQNITNKFTEFQIAHLWKEIKTNNIIQKLELEEDLEAALPEIMDHLHSIIDLSSAKNEKHFNEFYDFRKLHSNFLNSSSDVEDVDLEKRVNYAPTLISLFLKEEKQDFVNKLIAAINNAEGDSIETIEALEFESMEERLIHKMLLSFLEENNSFVTDIKELETEEEKNETFVTTLARIVAFIDLEDDQTLADHLNINNFSYINYTPSMNIDYEIVLRNYFADPVDGLDSEAINLYEIVNSQHTIHKSLSPINDQLYSLITTYYREKTKS
ncbi:hypothetical protein [Mycoplasmopsis glycophila]|uniref:Uncharacterized protein n=1 Tax=Mycoplasmopsis glycophila TaxID=171285 RepID=A0A449AV70_9BACT|nr:hypothetical protein [Mycoplasmopsis glycophila]VEU70378.1 Uncharacterised protein [Mycoplasmopsis glycophila]